jgi:hypothetical protein
VRTSTVFSIWLFCSPLHNICIAYFMAFMFSWETIGSIRVLGIVYVFFSSVIVDLCVLPWAPAVSVNNGSTFQPFALMASMSPWYFLGFYLGSIYHCSM